MQITKVEHSESEGGAFFHTSTGGRFFFPDGQEKPEGGLGAWFEDREDWMLNPWPATDDDNPTDLVDVSDDYQDLINFTGE